ncbi:MAG: hypothetical protein ABT00_14685 [Bordetella sp. SCN 68-11]|nr:NAD(P)H-dependent oxidoreductase [Rhodospirillales bacterium]ODU76939.1 MAG: hypothetical protein ABT00_14685 [Bordetella sp. SCN 68-11]OJY70415.1 MAG: hypothetical protein BGP12_22015 [Rhodospirillales bacterium 70-18]
MPIRRILHLDCSPKPGSFSRRASALVMARLAVLHPEAEVLRRDLGLAPPPHVDAAFDMAMRMPAEARGPADHAALALSEVLIGEIEATDALVIGTPMHNYTVPSCLKAWLDHVVRPRRAFGFGPQGKFGLLVDRPGYIVTAAGGAHGGAGEQPDFLVPYLRAILATIGIRSVRVLSLQGTTRGGGDPMGEAAAWLDAVLPLTDAPATHPAPPPGLPA